MTHLSRDNRLCRCRDRLNQVCNRKIFSRWVATASALTIGGRRGRIVLFPFRTIEVLFSFILSIAARFGILNARQSAWQKPTQLHLTLVDHMSVPRPLMTKLPESAPAVEQ